MDLRKGNEGTLVQMVQEKIGVNPDGYFGKNTETAVKAFQTEAKLKIDGIVGNGTLKALGLNFSMYEPNVTRGDKTIDWILPHQGVGFKGYNRELGGVDQFGTKKTIDSIIQLATEWNKFEPSILLQFGDISRRHGGRFLPHSTHRDGKAVDMRPIRADGALVPTTYQDAAYSENLTATLMILAHKHFSAKILFNDPDLIKRGLCRFAKGHHNHLHIVFN